MKEPTEEAEPIGIAEDRRGAFRCAISQAEESGLLRTRKAKLRVRVVEKSARGFALVTQPKPPIEVGQLLSLVLSAGTYEVRVAHITDQVGESRVGLALVREQVFMPPTGGWFGPARDWIFSNVGKGVQLIALVLICTVVLSCVLVFSSNSWREKLGFTPFKTAHSSPVSSRPAPEPEEKLAHSDLNLEGLKARKFFDALELSPEQQVKVQTVVEETSVALADLFKHKDAGPQDVWSDLGLQLIHRSYEKIQSELTDEQKARWAELSK
jgi:hypothetical protein